MKKSLTGKIIYYLLHCIGLLLLFIVLKDFQWALFGEIFASLKVWNFLFGLGMLAIVYLMKSYRWMLINREFGISLDYGTTLIYYLAAGFLSAITPGRLGDFTKIYFLHKKTGQPMLRSTTTVLIDRIWDVLILTMVGGISLIMILGKFTSNWLSISLIILIFAGSLSVIFFPGILFRPVLYIFRKKEKIYVQLDEVYRNWKEKKLKLVIPGIGISLASFLALAVIPLVFSRELGQDIGLVHTAGAVSISNMLSFLPVTVAGFGTRELVFKEIWNIIHLSSEAAISISSAYFLCSYMGSIIMGGLTYLVWFKKHFSIRQLTETKEKLTD